MTLGYRSILRLEDTDNAVKVAAEQVRSWLKEKHRDQRPNGGLNTYEWDGQGTHVLGPRAKLTVVQHAGEDSSNRLLLRLEEKNEAGVWRVSVTATSLPLATDAKQLIVVEVDADIEDDRGRPVSETTNPPNIVRSLMEVTFARDFHANVRLTASPIVVGSEDVDQLAEALFDARRTTSVVVAGAMPGAPLEAWSKIIGNLVKNSAGTTASFVLTEAAQERLNSQLTATHALVHGAVRTFLPGVVPSDKSDALRHRLLYPRSLADSLTSGMRVRPSLVRVHAAAARRQLIERPLPHEALRSARILEREELRSIRPTSSPGHHPTTPLENRLPADAISPQSSWPDTEKTLAIDAPAMQGPDSLISTVQSEILETLRNLFVSHTGSGAFSLDNIATLNRTLTEALQETEAHSARVDALLDNLNRVRDERDALKLEHENVEFELALEAEERRHEADERRRLERLAEFQSNRLRDLHDFGVFDDPDSGLNESPESLIDLLDRLESEERVAPFVQFTGNADTAIDLDIHDGLGRYAATFWEYILVMRDYCIEKRDHGFTGSLSMYLANDYVRGRRCDAKRFAPTESDSVKNNSKWSKERLLPVSTEVQPSGKVLMLAHFKTTSKDGVSPRMHIHDDTAGTGRIYIGYIGKHLSNTMTN